MTRRVVSLTGPSRTVEGGPAAATPEALPERAWLRREAAHEARVDAWTGPVLERHSRSVPDPVEDFLFDYYPYSPAQLRRWSPGHGRVLLGTAAERFLQRPAFVRRHGGVVADPASVPTAVRRLPWVRELLRRSRQRTGAFHCFGMHEWAMVHGLEQTEVRHTTLPLRVTPAQVERTVDEVGLRCTHFDAFRFFTDSARPLNAVRPTRASQSALEQAGCLHATMDLYKYAMWLDPLLPAEVKADAFDLARRCRTLDMQASPYDVSYLGLEPVAVETRAGRAYYVERQRAFADEGQRLRCTMLDEIDRIVLPEKDPAAPR